MDYNIFLIGFMGAGKSTVAAALSRKLGWQYIEMDQRIADRQGMSIPEIFDLYGEEYFRNLESNCLIELQHANRTIVSCGGGVVLRPENGEKMKRNGRVVLLTAEPETILARVKDSNDRPILQNHKDVNYIAQLMEQRAPKYRAFADITVATDGKSADEICQEIVDKLNAAEN